MIVTTSYNPSEHLVSKANELAEQWQTRTVRRGHMTIPTIQKIYQERDILVVTEEGLTCYRQGNKPLFFHPGSSFFRVKRMLASLQTEPMLQLAGVRPGDTVVDCTAGLCADAIMFSHAVGREGRVIAIEADPLISLIVREGLASLETDIPEMNEAMRRIHLQHGHHLEVLRRMPDQSADIIYFDPMFRSPVEASSGISPLRAYAYEHPLSVEAVEEARRVARRTIVLKELRGSQLFAELGFTEDDRRNAKIAYGVIHIR